MDFAFFCVLTSSQRFMELVESPKSPTPVCVQNIRRYRRPKHTLLRPLAARSGQAEICLRKSNQFRWRQPRYSVTSSNWNSQHTNVDTRHEWTNCDPTVTRLWTWIIDRGHSSTLLPAIDWLIDLLCQCTPEKDRPRAICRWNQWVENTRKPVIQERE